MLNNTIVLYIEIFYYQSISIFFSTLVEICRNLHARDLEFDHSFGIVADKILDTASLLKCKLTYYHQNFCEQK